MNEKIKEIIKLFNDYIKTKTRNINYSSWYIGITNNIDEMFIKHNINIFDFIYDNAESEKITRAVEEYFIYHGMKGDNDDAKRKGKWVYAYLMSKSTNL